VNLFRQLMEKPWVTGPGTVADLHEGGAFSLPSVTLGLRVFLAVASVLFSLLIVAYADRMTLGDWRPLPEPWLLWLNTAILMLSSGALH
jgi:cytochrome c oxidase subunit 3